MLGILAVGACFSWAFFLSDWQWHPNDVFKHVFGREPSEAVSQLRSQTFSALKGCTTFQLAFNAESSMIDELISGPDYVRLERDDPFYDRFDPDSIVKELAVVPPIDRKTAVFYRYTGSARPQHNIAVDEARRLVVIDVGFGPNCSP